MNKPIFFILSVLLLFSCEEKTDFKSKILGSWIVDTIHFKEDNFIDSLKYNVIFFKENSNGLTLKLPSTNISKAEIVKLTLNNNMNEFQVNSKSNIFSGVFRVKFIKNKSLKRLGAKFNSGNMTFVAYKVNADYELDRFFW